MDTLASVEAQLTALTERQDIAMESLVVIEEMLVQVSKNLNDIMTIVEQAGVAVEQFSNGGMGAMLAGLMGGGK